MHQKKNIEVPLNYTQKKSNLKINYQDKSPEQLDSTEKFDIILNLEIIEHVENVDLYLKSCSNLIKKGGLMFTTTLNRTATSYKSYCRSRVCIEMASDWQH